MKNKRIGMKLSIMLILFLIFVYSFGFAQKGFEVGYVVLSTKDTLYGSVKDRKEHPFGRLYKKIKLKGKKVNAKYRPSQILAYKKGGTTFESIWLSKVGGFLNQNYHVTQGVGTAHFLKVVQKGFLSYYLWEFEDADSGYIESVAYFKKEDNPLFIRVNQGMFGLKRKSLANFLNDYPELVVKINDRTIKNPIDIVSFYNRWKKGNP